MSAEPTNCEARLAELVELLRRSGLAEVGAVGFDGLLLEHFGSQEEAEEVLARAIDVLAASRARLFLAADGSTWLGGLSCGRFVVAARGRGRHDFVPGLLSAVLSPVSCPRCGFDVSFALVRCRRCGRPYPFLAPLCPFCGEPGVVKRCPSCGSRLLSDGRPAARRLPF